MIKIFCNIGIHKSVYPKSNSESQSSLPILIEKVSRAKQALNKLWLTKFSPRIMLVGWYSHFSTENKTHLADFYTNSITILPMNYSEKMLL